jgi:hypothetical protein
MDTKTCTVCSVVKPLASFNKDKKLKDGLRRRCKVCDAEYHRIWREKNQAAETARIKAWKLENIERERESARVRRAANLEYRRAYDRQWREANREKTNAATRKWKRENPEKRVEQDRAWRAANPGLARGKVAARRAARINAAPTWADQEKIAAVYAEAAALRALGIDCEVDHIVPLRGRTASGLHTHDNLVILLRADNRTKGNRVPDDPYAIEPTWHSVFSSSAAGQTERT